jgi:hypothetical protein
LHPLESAAFSRRTPKGDVRFDSWSVKLKYAAS